MARLVPVLWEDLALPATASFQEAIDFLLEKQPIDIAVFILWSRLGSPLDQSIKRADQHDPLRPAYQKVLDDRLTGGGRRLGVLRHADHILAGIQS